MIKKIPKWKLEYGVKHVLRSHLHYLKKANIITEEQWQELIAKIWQMYPDQKTINIFPNYWEKK